MRLATTAPVTLADVYIQNLAVIHDGLVSNAVAAYRRAWTLRVAPSLGSLALADIRPMTIANARAAWSGKDSTKQDALALLSRVLDCAVLDNLIPANPCKSVPRARRKTLDSDPVARALSDTQVRRMLELTAFHPYGQRALAGLAFTGLRLGELVGLMWSDLDLDQAVLTVRRTYSPDGAGRMEIRATKSGKVRYVPILDELLPHLDAAREAGHVHVFTGVRGGPFDSGNLARAVRWYSIRDQIATFADGTGLRFHDLRHTFLSRLSRLGVAPAHIQRVAGHASITTTELYTRSSAIEAALSVRDRLNDVNREVTADGGEAALDRRKIRPEIGS
jgi:integrase